MCVCGLGRDGCGAGFMLRFDESGCHGGWMCGMLLLVGWRGTLQCCEVFSFGMSSRCMASQDIERTITIQLESDLGIRKKNAWNLVMRDLSEEAPESPCRTYISCSIATVPASRWGNHFPVFLKQSRHRTQSDKSIEA